MKKIRPFISWILAAIVVGDLINVLIEPSMEGVNHCALLLILLTNYVTMDHLFDLNGIEYKVEEMNQKLDVLAQPKEEDVTNEPKTF